MLVSSPVLKRESPPRDSRNSLSPPSHSTPLPASLRAMGVTDEMIPRMVEGATKDHSTATNPRPVTREDFEELFRQAMG